MKRERVVVVGAGGISNAWFPPLIAEKVDVAAVVDLRVDAAKAQIAKYNLDALAATDLGATLRRTRPDFVLDLTVPEAHCRVTCEALRAGCHVIGEKPMAASLAQARKMVRVAEETGKLFMVSQSRRWDPLHETVRRTVCGRDGSLSRSRKRGNVHLGEAPLRSGGALGEVTTVNCDFYIGAHFGGFRDVMPHVLLADMSIHHFDLARFFTGAYAVSVWTKEFNPKGSWYRGNAAATCVFEMSNGAVFTYRGSWCAEGFHTSWNGNWRIVGARGTLLLENDQPPRAQVVASETGFHRELREVKLTVVKMEHKQFHGALREMLSFLRTGKRPQTECHDNIKSVAMVFAAIESAKKGKRVFIKT
jgi:predicted dehydrogenase